MLGMVVEGDDALADCDSYTCICAICLCILFRVSEGGVYNMLLTFLWRIKLGGAGCRGLGCFQLFVQPLRTAERNRCLIVTCLNFVLV